LSEWWGFNRKLSAVTDEPVHLVGHALGNRICRTITADHPERVASLALLAAGGMVEPTEETRLALLGCFNQSASPDVRRADIASAFFADDVVPAEWLTGWHPAVAWAQGRAVAATPRSEWWEAAAPNTVVIQGAQDQVAVPENGRRYVAEHAGRASLVEIERAGHALLPEQPERVAATVIAFLDRISGQTAERGTSPAPSRPSQERLPTS
jgi:pimeloyl-ACP methyl ester carboxylesterase